jgi:hypothetical protein
MYARIPAVNFWVWAALMIRDPPKAHGTLAWRCGQRPFDGMNDVVLHPESRNVRDAL